MCTLHEMPDRYPLPERDNVTGVILAGGQGMRMGGEDKGLLPLAGQPMIVHVLRALDSQISHVLINANRHQDHYRALGKAVISDRLAGHAGPLAGLASALANIDTPWLLCVPCDAPRLPTDLLRHFAIATRTTPAPLYVIRTEEGIQPVFCLVHHRLQDDLAQYLRSGGRTMRTWQQQAGAVAVSYPDPHGSFANINTRAALATLDAHDPEKHPV